MKARGMGAKTDMLHPIADFNSFIHDSFKETVTNSKEWKALHLDHAKIDGSFFKVVESLLNTSMWSAYECIAPPFLGNLVVNLGASSKADAIQVKLPVQQDMSLPLVHRIVPNKPKNSYTCCTAFGVTWQDHWFGLVMVGVKHWAVKNEWTEGRASNNNYWLKALKLSVFKFDFQQGSAMRDSVRSTTLYIWLVSAVHFSRSCILTFNQLTLWFDMFDRFVLFGFFVAVFLFDFDVLFVCLLLLRCVPKDSQKKVSSWQWE